MASKPQKKEKYADIQELVGKEATLILENGEEISGKVSRIDEVHIWIKPEAGKAESYDLKTVKELQCEK